MLLLRSIHDEDTDVGTVSHEDCDEDEDEDDNDIHSILALVCVLSSRSVETQ